MLSPRFVRAAMIRWTAHAKTLPDQVTVHPLNLHLREVSGGQRGVPVVVGGPCHADMFRRPGCARAYEVWSRPKRKSPPSRRESLTEALRPVSRRRLRIREPTLRQSPRGTARPPPATTSCREPAALSDPTELIFHPRRPVHNCSAPSSECGLR